MNLGRLLQVGFILAAAVFAYSFVSSAQDGELRRVCSHVCHLTPNYMGSNRTAPEIELKDLEGRPHRLSSFRGRTVVLVFWSTTCQTCKQQMPALADFAEVLKKDPRFAVLTVAVDDSRDKVRKILAETIEGPVPFPVLMDGESNFVLGKYGTRLFPETWIVDPDGVIRARFDGARDWSSSVALQLVEDVSRGDTCPLDVQGGLLAGKGAPLCRQQGETM